MNRIDAFLDLLVKQNGSDLHLVAGNVPRLRLLGDIYPVKYRELSADETHDLLYEIMPERERAVFEAANGVDFAYDLGGDARFRVNVFRHLDGMGAVFRARHLSLDRPETRVSEALMLALMPKHPYGNQTTIGSVEHLKTPAYQDMVDTLLAPVRGGQDVCEHRVLRDDGEPAWGRLRHRWRRL